MEKLKNGIYIIRPKNGSNVDRLINSFGFNDKKKEQVYYLITYWCDWYYRQDDSSKTYCNLCTKTLKSIFGNHHNEFMRKLVDISYTRKDKESKWIEQPYNQSYLFEKNHRYSDNPDSPFSKSYNLDSFIYTEEADSFELYQVCKQSASKGRSNSKNTRGKSQPRTLAELTLDIEEAKEIIERYSSASKQPIKNLIMLSHALNFNLSPYVENKSEKVHRVYTKLTQLPSVIRPALRFNGERIQVLDIKNCSALMLFLKISREERRKYLQWLKDGFYEALMTHIDESRESIKLGFQCWLAGERKNVSGKIHKVIEKEFPILVSSIELLTEANGKTHLSIWTQQQDAKLVTELMPFDLDCYTIHDAIVVPESQADRSKETMEAIIFDFLNLNEEDDYIPRIEFEIDYSIEYIPSPYVEDDGTIDLSEFIGLEDDDGLKMDLQLSNDSENCVSGSPMVEPDEEEEDIHAWAGTNYCDVSDEEAMKDPMVAALLKELE